MLEEKNNDFELKNDLTSIFGNITPQKLEESTFDKNKTIDIAQILTGLKFISEIKPHDKLCYNNLDINIDTSYFPSLFRYFNGFNRKNTIDTLEKIYANTYSLLEILVQNQRKDIYEIQKYKNLDLLQELIKHLDNSIEGLLSLKITYNNDKHIISRLDTLIKKIGLQKQYANECIKFIPQANTDNSYMKKNFYNEPNQPVKIDIRQSKKY